MKMYKCDICDTMVHVNYRVELKTDADYLIWKFFDKDVIDVCTDCFKRIVDFMKEERMKGGK